MMSAQRSANPRSRGTAHAATTEHSATQGRAVEACRKVGMPSILLHGGQIREDRWEGVRVEGPFATGKQAAPASLSGDTGRFREPHRRARSSDVLCGYGRNPGGWQAGRVVDGCCAGLVASL